MILEFLFFVMIASFLYIQIQTLPGRDPRRAKTGKQMNPKLAHYLQYGAKLYAEKKFIQAEKAYLGALRVDHKNIQAYTRLGMIYSAQKNLADGIECFQIVTQLDASATSFYNLGLIYFENRNYIKAIAAFEKSLMFEPSASRHIALAKTYQKIGGNAKMLESLEQAALIEPTKKHLSLLVEAYTKSRLPAKAAEAAARLEALDQQPPPPPIPGTTHLPESMTPSVTAPGVEPSQPSAV